MKLLILLLMISFNASAYKTSIVVPLATAHTGDYEYNEENRGIGFEVHSDDYAFSLVSIEKNSYYKRSVYLSSMIKKRLSYDFSFYAGLTVANGYESVNEKGVILFPFVSFQFKSIRIATTYPVASVICDPARCGDIINIQYIQEF